MPPRMSDADYQLSMRISPRARRPEDNENLRQLMILRLSETNKAAGRAALRGDRVSILCEHCETWTSQHLKEFPEDWDCPRCHRSYRMELAVYEEVESDEPVAQGNGSVAD